MAYTTDQVREQIDARKTKRHMDELAHACLEMGVNFSVNQQTKTVIISDLGSDMDRTCYFKTIPNDETPYMQSGHLLTLKDIQHIVNTFMPVARQLQPAYAMNYLEEK